MSKTDRQTFGRWTAVRGKLSSEDARAAFVMDEKGTPWASFWNFEEAVRYAKKRAAEEAT